MLGLPTIIKNIFVLAIMACFIINHTDTGINNPPVYDVNESNTAMAKGESSTFSMMVMVRETVSNGVDASFTYMLYVGR